MDIKFNYTIIGAGVIGLAIAQQLSRINQEDHHVLVIDKETTFGRGISSRNSEVIHSGIYYPTGSMKHRLCIKGRQLLYAYCKQRQVPHKKCGKLIVAYQDQELEALEKLYKHGLANQVEHMEMLSANDAKALEPDLKIAAAIYCKETGIVDTHQLMQRLAQDIEENKGTLVFNAELINLEHHSNQYQMVLKDNTNFYSKKVINAAGLGADKVALMLKIKTPIVYPCKGSYFSYQGKHSFKHLIYPLPKKELTGLGIHATLDMNNRLRFGPDTQYTTSRDDYTVDEKTKAHFYQAAKMMLLHPAGDKLIPDMEGIRPKLQGPDDNEVKDFYIQEEPEYPGFINLLGIESPGLTSALGIAEEVAELCLKI